jgi:hypothetical protein
MSIYVKYRIRCAGYASNNRGKGEMAVWIRR